MRSAREIAAKCTAAMNGREFDPDKWRSHAALLEIIEETQREALEHASTVCEAKLRHATQPQARQAITDCSAAIRSEASRLREDKP